LASTIAIALFLYFGARCLGDNAFPIPTRFELLHGTKGIVASVTINYLKYDKSVTDDAIRKDIHVGSLTSPEQTVVSLTDALRTKDGSKIAPLFAFPKDQEKIAADIANKRFSFITSSFRLIDKMQFGPYVSISSAPFDTDVDTHKEETSPIELHTVSGKFNGNYSATYFEPTDVGSFVFWRLLSAEASSLKRSDAPDAENATQMVLKPKPDHQYAELSDSERAADIKLSLALIPSDSDPGLKSFEDRLLKTLRTGSDDALKRLFDVPSATSPDEPYGGWFDSINGQQYVANLRTFFQAHSDLQALAIVGEPMSYLIIFPKEINASSTAPAQGPAEMTVTTQAYHQAISGSLADDNNIIIFRLRSAADRFFLTSEVDEHVDLLDYLLVDGGDAFPHPSLLSQAVIQGHK
jgi:hypothetical protein